MSRADGTKICSPQQFIVGDILARRKRDHFQVPERNSTRLVEHDGVHIGQHFQELSVLDEYAQSRGGGQRRDHRRRSRQDERPRASHNQERDRSRHVARHEQQYGRRQEHRGHIIAGISFQEPHHGRLRLFGRAEQLQHPAQRGLFANAGDGYFQHAGQVDRAGKQMHPWTDFLCQ